MDREQARRNFGTGLWLGLLAAGLFGLTFVVATIYIAAGLMAEREPIPEPTELVYVPRPSWGPPLFALGAALVVVGIYGEGFMVRGWVYMIAGAVIALAALRTMVSGSVRDFYVRPRRQRASTAVLPAGRLRAPRKQG